MTRHSDILIIGGGISGLLTARELVLAGKTVTLVDRGAPGQESSWAGGGILLPIYPWRQAEAISRLVLASLDIYPLLNQTLLETTGIDPELQVCGMLICQNPDIEAAEDWCQQHQIPHSHPSLELLQELQCSFKNPLWLPDIAQIRNPRLLKSLLNFLKQQGVRFLEHADIKHIEIQKNAIQTLKINDTTLTAEQFVLCAGAWSQKFMNHWLPESSIKLDIQPVRGQMLVFDAQPDTLSHMILCGDHYLIPRRDGKILAGSTVEHVGFEKVTTEQARNELYSFATQVLPKLSHYLVSEHWAGLRPGTPQGIPYIGFHPDIHNLSINAGHFRNGLIMGPASAQLLADLILNRSPKLDASPYRLTRPL
jgi:glycine oxidase